MTNLQQILKKYISTFVIIIFVTLIFSSHSFFNYQNEELRINELNQLEYIPTFNGECYYDSSEINTWLQKTDLNNIEIIYFQDLYPNQEYDIKNIKCLGKISGASEAQNQKVDSIQNGLDVVVNPTIILSHILFIFLITSIPSITVFNLQSKKFEFIFLVAILVLLDSFSSYRVFIDPFSWILFLVFAIALNKSKNDFKKYTLILISFLFGVNQSLLLLLFFCLLLMGTSKITDKMYNILYFVLLLFFLTGRVVGLSNTLKFNNDHYGWIVSAMRMNYLNIPEYFAFWDHKGPIISIVYSLILKLFGISNIWIGMSILYLLSILLVVIFFRAILLQVSNNLGLVNFTAAALTLILTLDPNLGLLKLDTRFLGSIFVFIGIYYYLVKNNLILFTLFLFLASSTLISFGLSQALITIFVIFIEKSNIEKIKKILIYNFIWFSILILYLFITNQLEEFFILNILFNIGLGETNYYYSLTEAILKSIIPFLVLLILSPVALKKSSEKKYFIILVWTLTEILHLKLTGPRFPDYQVILYIPLFLLSGFVLLTIINNYNDEFVKKYIKFSLLVSLLFILFIPNVRNYPKSNIGINNLDFGNQIYMSENTLSQQYSNVEVRNEELHNYRFGILIADLDQTKFDALFKYNIIPTTRTWFYAYHFRDLGINWENFFSDDKFETAFKNDIDIEKPAIAIIENTFNLNDSHLGLIKNYIDSNFLEKTCTEFYCVYQLK
jgi:hypothetical protein